jgi:hypothetical protein
MCPPPPPAQDTPEFFWSAPDHLQVGLGLGQGWGGRAGSSLQPATTLLHLLAPATRLACCPAPGARPPLLTAAAPCACLLQSLYERACEYMELETRVEVLNVRFQVGRGKKGLLPPLVNQRLVEEGGEHVCALPLRGEGWQRRATLACASVALLQGVPVAGGLPACSRWKDAGARCAGAEAGAVDRDAPVRPVLELIPGEGRQRRPGPGPGPGPGGPGPGPGPGPGGPRPVPGALLTPGCPPSLPCHIFVLQVLQEMLDMLRWAGQAASLRRCCCC